MSPPKMPTSSRFCALLLAASAPAVGCGRVGYDLLPHAAGPSGNGGSDAGNGPSDASVLRDSGPPGRDASVNGAGGRSFDAGGGNGGASFDAGTGGRITTGSGGGATLPEGGPDATDGASDAATCALSPSPVSDYCLELVELPAAPVIDGRPECGLPLHALIPVGWTGGSTPPDATAEYAVAWRPDGLYYFVRVHDPSLVPADPSRQAWQGDAVELFADDDGLYAAPPNYDTVGSRQLIVAAPSDPSSSAARGEIWAFGNGGKFSDWTSSLFRAFGTPDGYSVEAFVTAADLGLGSWTLAAGGAVGMDLSIDVSYPTPLGPDAGTFGNRVGQYFLRIGELDGGTVVLPPFDVRAFCRPTLVP